MTPDERKEFFRVPRVLYKYFDPYRLSVFSDFRMKYTLPSEFNDIFNSDAVPQHDDLSLNPVGSAVYYVLDPATGFPSNQGEMRDDFRRFLTKSAEKYLGYRVNLVSYVPQFPDVASGKAF